MRVILPTTPSSSASANSLTSATRSFSRSAESRSGGTAINPDAVVRLLGRRRVRDPVAGLSDREREVLALMAEGRSNSAIATRLYLNAKTVESHVRSVFTKLDLLPEPDDHGPALAVLAHVQRAGGLGDQGSP